MDLADQVPQSPDEFLNGLAAALRVHQGVDAGVAEVLTQHLLTAAPDENCVEHALDAINALAIARAGLPRENVDD